MSQEPESVRVDRWLFAVRIFKSRSLAAKAIAGGTIKVNGETVKAHRPLKLGDAVTLKRDGRTLRYVVTGLIEKRVGAKDAVVNYQLTEDPDLTPEMRETMKLYREMAKMSPRTRGRPTKRDRRQLDKLHGDGEF